MLKVTIIRQEGMHNLAEQIKGRTMCETTQDGNHNEAWTTNR
jgi:hypothetical protein